LKNVLFCRIFQGVMYLAEYLLPWREPKLLQGENALLKLPNFIKQLGIDNVMLMSGKTRTRAMLDPLLPLLESEGISYTIFDSVVPNPTIHNVEDALKMYKENGCKAIVALGGGSPLDCAKVVLARFVKPRQPVKKMKGVLKIMKKTPPLIAIPTTAGSGSETTLAAVITDSKSHDKYAISDTALIPKYAVLDPVLLAKLPPYTTATTGMDALCHAVEAYIGRANTKQTKACALESVLLIKENLFKCYENGQNLEARANMQRASYLAGLAFTRAYVGYVHALAHSLGGKYNTAHGLANAVLMPHVLKAYGVKAHKKLAELSDHIGLTEKDATKETKANAFISFVEDLNSKMAIPSTLSEIELRDLDELALHAEKEGNPLYPVPKILGKEDFKEIYKKVM